MPFSNRYEQCATGSKSQGEFCGDMNSCQVPWCYVEDHCEGENILIDANTSQRYSYSTCLDAPNCEDVRSRVCPFDSMAFGWSTRVPDCNSSPCQSCFAPELITRGLMVLFGLSCCGWMLHIHLHAGAKDSDSESDSDDSDDSDEEEEKPEEKS